MSVCFPSRAFATIVFVLVASSGALRAQHFVPATKGCKVEFKVTSHRDGDQIIKGALTGLKGKITFDPKSLNTSSFDITVSAGSIVTGMLIQDNAIKKKPFFNAAKYPVIRIRSTSITEDRPGGVVYTLHGNLTMKGITKPVNLQFMATPMDGGYVFRGRLEVSRLAFNIGTKEDKIDDAVAVFIEVRTSKK